MPQLDRYRSIAPSIASEGVGSLDHLLLSILFEAADVAYTKIWTGRLRLPDWTDDRTLEFYGWWSAVNAELYRMEEGRTLDVNGPEDMARLRAQLEEANQLLAMAMPLPPCEDPSCDLCEV